MKLHPDPTPEFADLAKTRYQRYVLFRLESSAAASLMGHVLLWCSLVILLSLGPIISGRIEFGWPAIAMMLFGAYSILEIYFSRAVLSMLRGRYSKEEKTDQQVVSSDGQPLPCSVTTADSTAPADAL
jgi:hypothetical protein